MKQGPAFTREEVAKFDPICKRFHEGQMDVKAVILALNRDRAAFERFKLYAKVVELSQELRVIREEKRDTSSEREVAQQELELASKARMNAQGTLNGLRAHTTMLSRKIENEKKVVEQSREGATQAIESNVRGVKVGPAKRQL